MKVLVTGGFGMMGRTINDIVEPKDIYRNHTFVFHSRKDCDLTDRNSTLEYFKNKEFDYIIHLAAAVGGLYKNMNANIDMFSKNIKINENVLEACHLNNIKRGIFCLSSCIYPSNPSKFPMDETMIHESPPHPSNEGYAYAKRMLELQTRQYNKTYGYQYICVVPVNLYGPHDNFNLQDSHFIPGIMHRFAVTQYTEEPLVAYGTGTPLRQFLFSYDFARIILNILFEKDLERLKNTEPIICCDDDEYTIKEVVEHIADTMCINKKLIHWDKTKSDGCLKKTVSNNKLLELYPHTRFTNLEKGLRYTYNWLTSNFDTARK